MLPRAAADVAAYFEGVPTDSFGLLQGTGVSLQVGDTEGERPLLARLPHFGLVDTIDSCIRSGKVTVDATQYEYLLVLLSAPPRPLPATGLAAADGASTSAQAAADGAGPSVSAAAVPGRPDDVTVASLVTSIHDMLPDFGKGFIEACLQCMQWDATEVTNALLSDTLPAAVRRLDRTAAKNPLLAPAFGEELSWDQARNAGPQSAGTSTDLDVSQAKGKSKYAGAPPPDGDPTTHTSRHALGVP